MADTSILKKMTCKTPLFRSQIIYDKPGLYLLPESDSDLDNNCFLGVCHDVLSSEQRNTYLIDALKVERKTGMSGFGPKPRSEVCYTNDGQPYAYSGKKHYTTKFPSHVLSILPILEESFTKSLNFPNEFTTRSNGVDIMYSDAFTRGGSISAHKDDELDWGLVLIFSLGQSRWIRIRNEETKEFYNVYMPDNSLVAMYGNNFQKCFTHQVDKLNPSEPVGTRLSLNVRYL